MTTELNNNTPIDAWRAAKEKVDNDEGYRARLGCVGEPISDVLDSLLELLEVHTNQDIAALRAKLDDAAETARGNLLDLVNGAREGAAELAVEQVHRYLEISCVDHHDLCIDGSETLVDVAQQGFEHATCLIEGHSVDVTIDDDELGVL
jgi:hypothetical protein